MKQFLLSITILFLTLFCHAQELRIVKDNINCSYGLKDKSGNWVIEPIYILIQEYSSGYFLVKDVLGDGVLSPSGKWIIECKYDRLYPAQPKWQIIGDYPEGRSIHPPGTGFFFFGHIGDRKLLLNSRGKQVVELSKLEQLKFDGDAHLLIHKNGPLTTSYLDTAGNVLIDNVPGAILPFGQKEYSLHGEGTEAYSRVMKGNVRLINRKGESLLDDQFDRAIFASGKRICFEQNSKYGEINTAGKLLIEPKYIRKVRLSSSPYINESWVIYNETGKVGLMNTDGTVILEPMYDEIKLPHRNKDFERLWQVSKDGLTGVFDDEGEMILPVSYNEITFVHDLSSSEDDVHTNFMVRKDGVFAYICPAQSTTPKEWYDRMEVINDQDRHKGASPGFKLITKKKDKFGILNLDGTVLAECIYEGHAARIRYSGRHFFWKDLEVVEFNFRLTEDEPTKWNIRFTKNRAILLTDSYSNISGKLSETQDKIIQLDTRNQQVDLFGNMLVTDRTSNGEWEVYNIKSDRKIELHNVSKITAFSTDLFLLRTRENRVGILNEDGKLLIDPIYLDFRRNNQSPYLWALTGKNEEGEDQWVLIDGNGEYVFSDAVKEPFRVNSGDLLMTLNDKTGLFDTEKFKWKIDPIYPCLFNSADDYYIAAFAENKKGILRSDGKVILPLEHESIRIFTNERYERDGITLKEVPQIRWLVGAQNNEMLVGQDGDQVSSVQEIRAFKESLLFRDTSLLDPFKDKVPEAPSLEELNSNHQPNGMQLFPQSIFDVSRDHAARMIRNFPSFNYTRLIPDFEDSTLDQARVKRKALWLNSDLKTLVFDSINANWNRGQVFCGDRFGRSSITVKQESTVIREFKKDCNCAKQNHFQTRGYNFGELYYRPDTIGQHFVSIIYGHHPRMDDRFMTMSQAPPPPPPAEHMNFVYRDGKAISIQLKDIFPSNSVLLQEFILALQKRDDLKLDCSSLETMVLMINGRFSLSEKGVHLYYHGFDYWHNEAIEFLIPLDRLKLHSESKWIVPILTGI